MCSGYSFGCEEWEEEQTNQSPIHHLMPPTFEILTGPSIAECSHTLLISKAYCGKALVKKPAYGSLSYDCKKGTMPLEWCNSWPGSKPRNTIMASSLFLANCLLRLTNLAGVACVQVFMGIFR
jgi:hypothetical protein